MSNKELKIVVVEDDDFQRKMEIRMLRSLGVSSIYDANNGIKALEIIRDKKVMPVDIVLCDLNMPEMDGLEFLRHLGQERHNVAIVIISSLSSKLLLSVGKMTKMHGIKLLGVVEKPVTTVQLEELFSKYERSENRWQQPDIAHDLDLEEVIQGIRDGQFEPYYQPKVDLQTGRLIGAEALARWLHPVHGVIAPGAFIPLLERSGSIDDLTFVMLEKAVIDCRSFSASGALLSISVNLSLVSLDDTLLADKITQMVRGAGVDPACIVLEITESAAMTDVAHALENLARLCMNGFALSIDDYGTGYSSLQQLTRIPFSELKIDQSFVKDFAENEVSRIVVESSVNMAHELRIKSIAEGVETQEDWDTLKGMGCDTAQGYHIARPMDAVAFLKYCRCHASGTPV